MLSEPTARDTYNQKLEQTLVDYEDDYTGNALSKVGEIAYEMHQWQGPEQCGSKVHHSLAIPWARWESH